MADLSMKEKKFLSEYVKNGGNGAQAAMVAYDAKNKNSAAVIASHALSRPSVASALKAELERQGITVERIIKPIADGLSAVDKDGNEDHRARLMAHDRAVKIMGLNDEKEQSNPAINFNINNANFGGEFVENDEN